MSHNNYSQKPQRFGENKENLDFKTILFDALKRMNIAIIENDMLTLANSLQAIEVLLTNKITDNYKKEFNELEKKYNNESRLAGVDRGKKAIAGYNKLLSWSKIIMKLIQASGYMPEMRGEYGRKSTTDDDDEE